MIPLMITPYPPCEAKPGHTIWRVNGMHVCWSYDDEARLYFTPSDLVAAYSRRAYVTNFEREAWEAAAESIYLLPDVGIFSARQSDRNGFYEAKIFLMLQVLNDARTWQ